MSLKSHIPLWLRAPRNSLFIVLAALLLAVIAMVSPVQLPVVLYKAALIALAAVIGYWLDRALFPYARPDMVSTCDRSMAGIRRALVVLGCVLGLTLGL